jgi:hypothetical protein
LKKCAINDISTCIVYSDDCHREIINHTHPSLPEWSYRRQKTVPYALLMTGEDTIFNREAKIFDHIIFAAYDYRTKVKNCTT